MSGSIEIVPCHTGRERQAFEDVAELLQGENPAFVPPFPGSIAKYLSEKSAFCKRHGEIIPFIARRDGKPVGRIAAIINRSHNAYYKDRTGFFGFFDCENNFSTAKELFKRSTPSSANGAAIPCAAHTIRASMTSAGCWLRDLMWRPSSV